MAARKARTRLQIAKDKGDVVAIRVAARDAARKATNKAKYGSAAGPRGRTGGAPSAQTQARAAQQNKYSSMTPAERLKAAKGRMAKGGTVKRKK